MSLFITFEGGEGSGKTTQCKMLYDFLLKSGVDAVLTREPGGTKSAEEIRNILLVGSPDKLGTIAETLLYMASRSEHWEKVIKPALNAGKVVVSDRFQDSTTVYQGMVKGADLEMLQCVYNVITSGQTPDITFVLSIRPEVGLQRAMQRHNNETRFEKLGIEFHKKVNKYFEDLAKTEDRFEVLNAEQDVETLHNLIIKKLEERGFL